MKHYMSPTKERAMHATIAGLLASVLKGDIAGIVECKSFLVHTIHGSLRGRLYHGSQVSPRRMTPPWVFFQFREPSYYAGANQDGSRLNKYSGKWNWMFGAESSNFEMTDMVVKLAEMSPDGFTLTENWD